MTRENEFYAYLTFFGEFDPEEITDRLQVTPTDFWRKGDVNERTHLERKFSRWNLRSSLAKNESLVNHVRDVFAQLAGRFGSVRQIKADYDGAMQLVAYFHSESPWFHFDEDIVAGCAAMDLSIDCDFYTLYSDRRDDSLEEVDT